MKTIGYIFLSIFIFIGLILLGFFMTGVDLVHYQFFAPKFENARREVFENTQSYVEGKRQELTKYRLEYLKSKDEQEKEAIKMTILQSFANFDETKLDYNLRIFLDSLKN